MVLLRISFFIKLNVFFKKIWLGISLLLIFLISEKKADEEDSTFSNSFFFDGSKKSERLLNNLIWSGIFIYLTFGIFFSVKNFR
jgi:hypothetical protein